MRAELEKHVGIDENGMEVAGSARWVLLVNGVPMGDPFTDLAAATEALNSALDVVPIQYFSSNGPAELKRKLRVNEIYEKTNAFDFSSVLSYYCLRNKITREQGEAVLSELKRWLTICAAFPAERFVIGGEIDRLWHTFIVHTVDYITFCKSVCGFYINHTPGALGADGEPSSASNQELQKTLSAFREYFGEEPLFDIQDSEKYMRSAGENCGSNASGGGVFIGVIIGGGFPIIQ